MGSLFKPEWIYQTPTERMLDSMGGQPTAEEIECSENPERFNATPDYGIGSIGHNCQIGNKPPSETYGRCLGSWLWRR
jgi:hypothetical protein